MYRIILYLYIFYIQCNTFTVQPNTLQINYTAECRLQRLCSVISHSVSLSQYSAAQQQSTESLRLRVVTILYKTLLY